MIKRILYITFSFFMIFGSYLYLSPLEDEKYHVCKGDYTLVTKNTTKENKPAKFHYDKNASYSIHPGDISATIGDFTFYLNKTIVLDFSIKKGALAGDILFKIKKNGDNLDTFVVKSKPKINKRIIIDVKYGDIIEISADKHGSLAYDWGNLKIYERGLLYEFNKYVIPFLWFLLFVLILRKGFRYIVLNMYVVFYIILIAEKLNFGALSFYEIYIYMLFLFSIMFFFILIYQELNIFKKFKIASIFSMLLSFMIYLIPISFVIYHLNFNSAVTNEILFAVFQTNGSESYEFIFDYINVKYIALLLFVTILIGILFYKEEKSKINNIERLPIFFLVITFFGIAASQLESLKLPHFVLSGLEKYTKEIMAFKEVQEKRKTNNIKFIAKKDGKGETYVVLIGESLNKKHMGIYGYFRNTTPLLNKMGKDNKLMKFNNIYSNHTVTTYVLSLALTEANQYNNKSYYTSLSVIDILKEANIETYWLTNQSTYGAFDNLVTVIAKTADHFSSADITRYDGQLIKKLKKILLKKTDNNRVIFIHLLGNHYTYASRYPKDKFNFFKNKLTIGEFGSVGYLQSTVNQYDNSVLYNDFVVSSIFKEIQKEQGVNGVLYFSDHGEDVIRNRSHNPNLFTYDMIHIPMLAWFSKKYQEKYPLKYKTLIERNKTLFSNDMIYDTLLGIFSITTDKYSSKYDFSSLDYRLSDDEALILHKSRKYKNKDNYIYYQEHNKQFIDTYSSINAGVYNINSIGKLNEITNADFKTLACNVVYDATKSKLYIVNKGKKTELTLEKYISKIRVSTIDELILNINNLNAITSKDIIKNINEINKNYGIKNKITLSIKKIDKYINNIVSNSIKYIYDIRDIDLNNQSNKEVVIKNLKKYNISNLIFKENMYSIIKSNLEQVLNIKLSFYMESNIKLSNESLIKSINNQKIYNDTMIKRILFKYTSKYDDSLKSK